MYTETMLEEFDPTPIEDENLCQVFMKLMNLVETLSAKVKEQAEEIQRLRDENQRLKGEQGKPKILPNTKVTPTLSSEKERRVSKAHHKRNKQAQIKIDRVEIVEVPKQHLPVDAQFKGI
jgi:regulator of replication initiation timing